MHIHHLIKKLTIFLLILFSFSLFSVSTMAFEDALLAIVDDEVITLKDLRDYIRMTYVNLSAQGKSEEELRLIMSDLERNGINKLIEDKLILNRANQLGLDVKDKSIDEELEKAKSRYPSSQTFMNALEKNGTTLTDMRNKIAEQLKIKFTINFEVRSKIFVNPNEVTKFYNQYKNNYVKKERVNLDSIYFDYKDSPTIAKQRAEEALKKIKEGNDFNAVAKEYSDTTSIGIIERGQLVDTIENVIFALEDNEYTDLIEIDTGIYIFKIVSKVSADIASLKEVKKSIKNQIFQLKFKEKFETWLKDLKQNAFIEIKE